MLPIHAEESVENKVIRAASCKVSCLWSRLKHKEKPMDKHKFISRPGKNYFDDKISHALPGPSSLLHYVNIPFVKRPIRNSV